VIVGRIIEAGRLAPTPHNMQNFEVVMVDEPRVLRELGRIETRVTEAFIRENYRQLSFSRRELLKKGTGLLADHFPKSWRDPSRFKQAARESLPWPLSESIDGSPLVLVVLFDPGLRAPDSPGDFLGILGLGCVMENMWLEANACGVAVQVMSDFGEDPAEPEVKRVLGIPSRLRVAYALRLGYPVGPVRPSPPVRRPQSAFSHKNRYQNSSHGGE
jgi:nitroreductase